MFSKQKIAMLVAEFFGTAFLALTVLAVSTSNIGIGYFVSFAAGLTLILMVLAIGGISGAHINPAVTIGLWTVRQIETSRAILYIAAQLLGGYAAYWLFGYMTGNYFESKTLEYDTKILVAEALGAAIFTFGIGAAVYQKLTGITKALVIGGSLTAGIIVASVASAAYLNPAIALAGMSWQWGTYVLGPVLGGIIGINVYNLLFAASLSDTKKTVATTAATPAKKPAAKTKKATARKKPAAKTSKKK